MDGHERFMRLALELAAKGKTSPNPMVGAVLVKNGKIVGRGFHRKAGEPHAEVEAIRDAGKSAKGSTLYVTLEPCSHLNKRTPPCTRAIIAAGIRKVYAAVKDPNPLVKGNGAEELRRNGIEVQFGPFGKEAERLNEAFFKFMRTGLPFVLVKCALTFDGKIASADGDSKWVSGEGSRRVVHGLRSRHDAIVVGANTVLVDDPRLTARVKGGRNPVRVIADGKLKVNAASKVFADGNFVVATCEGCDRRKKDALEKKGGRVWVLGKERVDMERLIRKLGESGITSVMVEGGGEVIASAFEAGIVDKFVFFIAPKIIGGRGAPGPVGGKGIARMKDALQLRFARIERIGEDILVEAYPRKG